MCRAFDLERQVKQGHNYHHDDKTSSSGPKKEEFILSKNGETDSKNMCKNFLSWASILENMT